MSINHKGLDTIMAIWASSSSSPSSLFSSLSGKPGAEQESRLQPELVAKVEIQVNDGVTEDHGDMETWRHGEPVITMNVSAPSLSEEEQDYDSVVVTLESEVIDEAANYYWERKPENDHASLMDEAAFLLGQHRANAEAEIEAYKSQHQDERKKGSGEHKGDQEERVTNKLDKNNENFDKQEGNANVDDAISPDDTVDSTLEEATLSGSRVVGNRLEDGSSDIIITITLTLRKTRHQLDYSHKTKNSALIRNSKPLRRRATVVKARYPCEIWSLALEETNDNTAMPDALRTRGLIHSIIGAHHCTPQFCVNVSLSDGAKFATFHIERPLEETGWISLGIGYAMTMADLLIFWPNLTPENGGGPRGAILSRRASHAYIEPHLVGSVHGTRSEDGSSEADLYPPDEYILHNANSGASVATAKVFPDSSKFIVQFTRPVRTKNLDYKLTPGQIQDFCWAYSPRSISSDSVTDPGAHITQHSSVGTFAMDVAANQPHLKETILKQQAEDEKLDAAEKARKKEKLEETLRKLEGNDAEKEGGQDGEDHVVQQHSAKRSEAISWLSGWGRSSNLERGFSALALQGFSCLVAIALIIFFR
ncbi:MAG: hypothetical protein J3Q66DRAFT_409967 [Benniella sp.]|nr:MAG: hypothetical protein J3Q66DRAFT_409967 [Benniella sp.]